jgi:hypothetical protein
MSWPAIGERLTGITKQSLRGNEKEHPMSSEITVPASPQRADKTGRGIAIGFTSLLGLFGVMLTLGGAALIGVHAFARDDDGYYSTETEQLVSDGYAVSTAELDLAGDGNGFGVEDLGASLRVNATSNTNEPLFIGIASQDDAERYLAESNHSVVSDFGKGGADYDQVSGTDRPGQPASQDIWVASSEGTGEQRVQWEPDNGRWAVVAMNADASQGVDLEVDAGAKVSWLIWVGIGLSIIGLGISGLAGFVISKLTRSPKAA